MSNVFYRAIPNTGIYHEEDRHKDYLSRLSRKYTPSNINLIHETVKPSIPSRQKNETDNVHHAEIHHENGIPDHDYLPFDQQYYQHRLMNHRVSCIDRNEFERFKLKQKLYRKIDKIKQGNYRRQEEGYIDETNRYTPRSAVYRHRTNNVREYMTCHDRKNVENNNMLNKKPPRYDEYHDVNSTTWSLSSSEELNDALSGFENNSALDKNTCHESTQTPTTSSCLDIGDNYILVSGQVEAKDYVPTYLKDVNPEMNFGNCRLSTQVGQENPGDCVKREINTASNSLIFEPESPKIKQVISSPLKTDVDMLDTLMRAFVEDEDTGSSSPSVISLDDDEPECIPSNDAIYTISDRTIHHQTSFNKRHSLPSERILFPRNNALDKRRHSSPSDMGSEIPVVTSIANANSSSNVNEYTNSAKSLDTSTDKEMYLNKRHSLPSERILFQRNNTLDKRRHSSPSDMGSEIPAVTNITNTNSSSIVNEYTNSAKSLDTSTDKEMYLNKRHSLPSERILFQRNNTLDKRRHSFPSDMGSEIPAVTNITNTNSSSIVNEYTNSANITNANSARNHSKSDCTLHNSDKSIAHNDTHISITPPPMPSFDDLDPCIFKDLYSQLYVPIRRRSY